MFTVKVVNSSTLGKKSKILPPSIFYVCCDKNTALENKYDSLRSFIPIPTGAKMAKEKASAMKANKTCCNPAPGIKLFNDNFPEDKVVEIINFMMSKKIKELHLGDKTFPYSSHTYEIAEFISPTGGEFTLKAPQSKDHTYKNQRDFERMLSFYPISYRNRMIQEFENYITVNSVTLHIEMPKKSVA